MAACSVALSGTRSGAPVESWPVGRILAEYGDRGVRSYREGAWPAGTITANIQMTLFTVEGLVCAGIRRDRGLGLTVGMVHRAYDDWLDTQQLPGPGARERGLLRPQAWLYARRFPARTCLTALRDARGAGARITPYGGQARNDSKGCGGVPRAAPFGLLPPDRTPEDWYFDAAAEAAGYTHGHPTGRLAAGAFASIVHHLVAGAELPAAVAATLRALSERDGHRETAAALREAVRLAEAGEPGVGAVESLGEGRVAEEALAIVVYSALALPEPERCLDALSLAVTHSGTSTATGALCGDLLGAWHGETALPPELVFGVEGRGTILELASDLVLEFTTPERLHGEYGPYTGWTERYRGG